MGNGRWVIALGVACAALAFAACGGGDDSGGKATATPVGTGAADLALNVFIREAVKSNWFAADDDIDFKTEELLFADATARSEEVGLPIYATEPGPPPYKDGLPGVFIVAKGDFYDYTGPAYRTPGPDTPRRAATAIAFVDELGRISYAYRFNDGKPPATPELTPTSSGSN